MMVIKLILGLFVVLIFSLVSAQPLVIAHRGDSEQFIENTYPAILAAVSAGADKVEIDVQASNDNIVVFHDRKVGNRWVDELDLATLRQKVGYQVPTLQTILAKNQSINYLLDLKTTDKPFINMLIEQIIDSGYPLEQLALQSENIDVLAQLKTQLPQTASYYLYRSPLFSASTAELTKLANTVKSAGIDGISIKGRRYINKAFITALQNSGLTVFMWNINDKNRIKYYQSLGVDGIITDNFRMLTNQ